MGDSSIMEQALWELGRLVVGTVSREREKGGESTGETRSQCLRKSTLAARWSGGQSPRVTGSVRRITSIREPKVPGPHGGLGWGGHRE